MDNAALTMEWLSVIFEAVHYNIMPLCVHISQLPCCGSLTAGHSPLLSAGTGSPDLCSVATLDYDKFAHQICDLIATVPARVWDSTLGSNSIELKRLLAKR